MTAATFPDGFVWGTATASYQIEGAVAEDGRAPSIWDTFSQTPGKVRDGDTGDVACDHYHRVGADVDLMRGLGVGAYRFSIAWPRVAPDGVTLNAAGLDFYDRLVDTVLAAGIDPYATLYHWDLPQALEDVGGWRSRDTARRFADYSAAVVTRLGDRVRTWVTLNEPWCSAYLGHLYGLHAPGLRDRDATLASVHHLLLGHGLAVDAIRSAAREPGGPGVPATRVGIVLNLSHVRATGDTGPDPDGGLPFDERLARIADPAIRDAVRAADGQANRIFTDPLRLGRYPVDVVADMGGPEAFSFVREGDLDIAARRLDFLGINYYMPARVAPFDAASAGDGPRMSDTFVTTDPRPPLTGMGWEQDPAAFTELLLRVSRENPDLAIYVTENGSAWPEEPDADGVVHDTDRIAYLHAHLGAVRDAIAGGADVRGYFAWSLMDNFEWAEGYAQRFGLVRVDYDTQRRTVKDSGHAYAAIAARNALP